jgi:DNA-directed RNA polymerase subunit H (RpoH/RPB5)
VGKEAEYETAARRMHNQQYFQQAPKKEIGLVRVIDAIHNLFYPKKISEVKNIYEVNPTAKISLGNLELNRVYLPENSFISYINNKIPNYNMKELSSTLHKISKTAKSICANKKGLENRVHETTVALLYDDLLKEMFVEENQIPNIAKKYKIKELSQASNLPEKKIKDWTRKIKEENKTEILKYKQENNLLTYTDLKQFEKMNKHFMSKIRRELNFNSNETYTNIAKKYGLKNGKVVSRIMRDTYRYAKEDLFEKIKYMKTA